MLHLESSLPSFIVCASRGSPSARAFSDKETTYLFCFALRTRPLPFKSAAVGPSRPRVASLPHVLATARQSLVRTKRVVSVQVLVPPLRSPSCRSSTNPCKLRHRQQQQQQRHWVILTTTRPEDRRVDLSITLTFCQHRRHSPLS